MKRIAVTGGDVITPAGLIGNGLVLIRGGRIEYAGAARTIPLGACEKIDAGGLTVSPGLIDAHTHLGVYAEGTGAPGEDGNEMIDPVTPHVRAIDSIDHTDRAFIEAREGGVTCVMITPGSANVIGGSICAAKTFGRTADDMVIAKDIGQKMATGENPKRVYGEKHKAPMTRMGIAAVLRSTLVEAINYKKKVAAKKDTARDLKLEALQSVVAGKLPARVHAHRADDIMTAIRIAEEFGLKLVIEHGTEAYKIADILAAKKIPVNIGPTSSSRSKIELKDLARDNAVRCMEAGVRVALITDHPVMPIQDIRQEAIKLVRDYGADRTEVFKTVTINPAITLGVEKRVGSLEKGKDADIAIFTGHPLDGGARCVMTMVDGAMVFDGREGKKSKH
ncbi:MAG: amidohydrolase [Nitrospinae bacterium]|nr:amidohydrolase [Nitrospinota bacterium]